MGGEGKGVKSHSEEGATSQKVINYSMLRRSSHPMCDAGFGGGVLTKAQLPLRGKHLRFILNSHCRISPRYISQHSIFMIRSGPMSPFVSRAAHSQFDLGQSFTEQDRCYVRRSEALLGERMTQRRVVRGARVLLCVSLSLLMLASFTHPTFAESKLKVFVAPALHDGQKNSIQIAKKLDSSLRDYLKRNKKMSLADGKAKRRDAGNDQLMEAESLKVSSIDLYLEGKYEKALEGFISSLKGFQRNIAAIRDMKSVFQTLYYTAATCMELEYDADAKDYFRQLATISPEGHFEVKVPAKVEKKYLKERKKLLRKKRGAISIETIPLGVKVWINGKEACVSPCEVKELPRGRHYVWAKKPGVGQSGRLVKVKGGKSASVKLNLSPQKQTKPVEPVTPEMSKVMVSSLGEGKIDGVLKEQLDQIAEEQQVDYVIFTYMVVNKRQAHLFSFLYNVNSKLAVAASPRQFRLNFAATRVAARAAVRELDKLIQRFPEDQNLDGSYPPIVEALKQKSKPKSIPNAPLPSPTVAIQKSPVPAATPPAKSSTPPMKKREPKRPTPPQVAQTPPPLGPSTPKDLTAPPPSSMNLLPPPPMGTAQSEEGGSNLLTNPWFWTGVGAVVVSGAALGTYFALGSSSDQDLQRFQSRVVW